MSVQSSPTQNSPIQNSLFANSGRNRVTESVFCNVHRGGFRGGGGGGGGRPPPSGIRPPADPKDPPLYYFEISIFGDGPKIFLKAPIYTNFEGGAPQN